MPRLRRSDPSGQGFTRRKAGRGFTLLDERGARITDEETLRRIRALVIPPAWTDVWICPVPNGHIQAVGTDDAGRRQYLYHPYWQEVRSEVKFERARGLGSCLPNLRRRLRQELDGSHLSQERVMACAVRLLDLGAFRVGSETYAKQNASFGLATLRRDHVHLVREGVAFEFPAKSGQLGQVVVTDPYIREIVARLLRRHDGSPDLLAWWDRSRREWVDVKSTHINEHLRTLTRQDLTAKDFRTWHGSVLMAMNLAVHAARGESLTKRRLAESYREVSLELGNTPAVVRGSYVDPRVVDLAERGRTIPRFRAHRHELVPTKASTSLHELLAAEQD